jgi:hypothetical protein
MVVVMTVDLAAVEKHRSKRLWRHPQRRVRSRANARAFVESAGFALVFPSDETELPSLWEAYTDEPFELGWSDAISTLWSWREEMPSRREAASGPFFRGKASLIAPKLLGSFVSMNRAPRVESELMESVTDKDQKAVLQVLIRRGPTPRIALAQEAGLMAKSGSRRFSRAVEALERGFRVARVGVDQEAHSNWPSVVYDLFMRAFPQAIAEAGEMTRDQALQTIVRTHFEAVAAARPRPVANALSIRTREADKIFGALKGQGIIEPANEQFPEGTCVLVPGVRRVSR